MGHDSIQLDQGVQRPVRREPADSRRVWDSSGVEPSCGVYLAFEATRGEDVMFCSCILLYILV